MILCPSDSHLRYLEFRRFVSFCLIYDQATMPRQVYLAVFSNGSKPAHWAIYIPTTGQQQVGKTVHVTGNTATGFYLEFKRNHDPSEEGRHLIIPLGEANEQYITDTAGEPSRDTTARDRFETTALTVPPPGRSPNPFDPAVCAPRPNPIFVSNKFCRPAIVRTGL